jgi:hypothetical protein
MRHLSHQGVLTYDKALAKLNTSRNKGVSIKLCPNTMLIKLDDNSIVVKFWNTNIITYFPDGSIVIDTNGYWTVTTKARLNEFLPGHIRVYNGKRCNILCKDDVEYRYTDGILIDARGKVHAEIIQPPIIEYLGNFLNIMVKSIAEALEVISTLDNKSLWRLWQRCTSLRSNIARFAPMTFLPMTISSVPRGRRDNWIEIVEARLDGETYDINQVLRG